MPEIRYCDQCGHANEINARFCGKCRHTLSALSPSPNAPISSSIAPTRHILPYLAAIFGLLLVIAGILFLTKGCIAGLDLFHRCAIVTHMPTTINGNSNQTETSQLAPGRVTRFKPTPTHFPTSTATPRPSPTVTPSPTRPPTATPSPSKDANFALTVALEATRQAIEATQTVMAHPSPTSIPTSTPLPTTSPDIIIEDFEGSFNVIEVNRSPGNNILNLSLVNSPTASGNKSLEMNYQINGATPDQDDYVGFRASFTGPSNWQGFSAFCIWVQNGGYTGHLVVQIHPQQGGRWKAAIPLRGFSSGIRCVSFVTDFIERGGPLVDIQNYEIYLGAGGATSGTIYLDHMRLIP